MLFMAISVGGVAVWTMHFVGMSAVSFVDPDGVAMTVHYRVDLTMTSLVIVIILCYIGIYMCSHDAAFVMDNVDTVDAFIAQASKMSINRIRFLERIFLISDMDILDACAINASTVSTLSITNAASCEHM